MQGLCTVHHFYLAYPAVFQFLLSNNCKLNKSRLIATIISNCGWRYCKNVLLYQSPSDYYLDIISYPRQISKCSGLIVLTSLMCCDPHPHTALCQIFTPCSPPNNSTSTCRKQFVLSVVGQKVRCGRLHGDWACSISDFHAGDQSSVTVLQLNLEYGTVLI